jgi:ankyrin repeat protein
VDFLLRRGLSAKAVDASGRTPIFSAANFAVAKRLLDAGLRLNARDRDGMTPLHYAAYECRLDGVLAMIDLGADLSALTPQGTLPVQEATCVPVVKELLARRPGDIAARTPEGNTMLHAQASRVSAMSAPSTLLEFLIERNALVNTANKAGRTPIFHMLSPSSIPERRQAGLAILLQAEAKVDIRDKKGRMPIHAAATADCLPDEVDLLVEAGAQLNVRDREGNTPLMLAVLGRGGKSTYERCAEALLTRKADPNVADNNGRTALHLAAGTTCCDASTVKLLLRYGANRAARDQQGRTPAEVAKAAGNVELVRVLAGP